MDSSKLPISQLLSSNTVILSLRSVDRDSLFAELIDQIPGIEAKPGAKQTLLRAVCKREKMHTTGVGDGLAIPHARNAIPGVTDQAVIVFGRHDQGIDYGAVDGAPVRLFFLLFAPKITEHLHILARLSRLLRQAPLRKRLLQAGTACEVIEALAAEEKKLG